VSPEAKKRAAEAKSRGDEAFHRKDHQMAVDFYTQVRSSDPSFASYVTYICCTSHEQPLLLVLTCVSQ